MFAKFFVIFAIAVSAASAGVIPLAGAPAALVAPAAYAVAPYASSYAAHTVNHAVAEPVYANAPVVAAAPLVAPAAPFLPAARYISSPYFF